jgi:uncharacterized protein YdeI (YjbR/CyaY-like superfamily)
MTGRTMITDVETYFALGCGRCDRFGTDACATRLWAGTLAELRRICRDAGLAETAKWGHPCYMLDRRNIAILGAFRGEVRLSFFNAGLLTDPARVLVRQGPNSGQPDAFRFTGAQEVRRMEPTIRAYLSEAMEHARHGRIAPRPVREVTIPDDLADALDADPEMAEAFHALTPGRQRSYVIALASAKKPQTRRDRIARFRDGIIAGKGATER